MRYFSTENEVDTLLWLSTCELAVPRIRIQALYCHIRLLSSPEFNLSTPHLSVPNTIMQPRTDSFANRALDVYNFRRPLLMY